jgi:hypothetical protein
VGAAPVFGKVNIQHPVELVFNAPVIAHQQIESLGISL